MRAAACHYHGFSQDRPRRIGSTYPSTPSPTQCSSSSAPTATPPFQSPPSICWVSYTPTLPHAGPTRSLSSSAKRSLWESGKRPRRTPPDMPTDPRQSPIPLWASPNSTRVGSTRGGLVRATSAPTHHGTTTARLPALAVAKPPRTSSTPSSTAQLRNLPGPATFRGLLRSAPMPPFGPRLPSWAPSPVLLGLRPPPFPRACSLARLLPQVLFLPLHLM